MFKHCTPGNSSFVSDVASGGVFIDESDGRDGVDSRLSNEHLFLFLFLQNHNAHRKIVQVTG